MGKRLQRQIAPRPQSQSSTSPATRHINELSKGKVIDLTAESSSGDSLITGTQLELVEAPVTTPQGLAPAVVTSKAPVVHPLTNPARHLPQGLKQRLRFRPSHFSQRFPAPFLRLQLRTRLLLVIRRLAIPPPNLRAIPTDLLMTRLYGDPLRHSVKSVTESNPAESSSQRPITEQTITTPFTPIVRKGSQVPFPRTKEQTTPFKKIRIDEHDEFS